MKDSKTYVVYLLPFESYIGVTGSFKARLANHRRLGRSTSYAEILGTFKDREMAYRFEATFHEHPSLKGGRNKYRGIVFHKTHKYFQVVIDSKFIGSRETIEEAIELRNKYYKTTK